MSKRQRGRKVPPLQPRERQQYPPGQLINSLAPIVRQNIEQLAMMGYGRDGRGLLLVEISDEADTGIVSAEYFAIMRLSEMSRTIPFAEAQPMAEAVKRYDPEREFVALILNVTPSLPGPQIWFEIFPRENQVIVNQPERSHATMPAQASAMATAYALIEDMARTGFAAQGRGFVFYAIYPDGTAPYVQYLTLDRPPGDGFSASAPDLVELVRTYDPQTAFVLFEGTINLDDDQLEHVRIEVYSFLTGHTVSSA